MTNYLNEIAEQLKGANLIFGESVYVNDKYQKYTIDNCDIPALILSRKVDDEANDFVFDSFEYDSVTGCSEPSTCISKNSVLAVFECVDTKKAMYSLAGQLSTQCGAKITSAGCNAEKIYYDEYGVKLERELMIVRINFEIKEPCLFTVVRPICEEDCNC